MICSLFQNSLNSFLSNTYKFQNDQQMNANFRSKIPYYVCNFTTGLRLFLYDIGLLNQLLYPCILINTEETLILKKKNHLSSFPTRKLHLKQIRSLV